jgi:uncharacterized protein (TIGR00106 family)
MLADISIIPVGGDTHTSTTLADVVKAIEASGLEYQLTPTTTCIEGTWDEIVTVAKRCHEIARKSTTHVVTLLRIEDDTSGTHKLRTNVESVEEKAGQPFEH